MWVVVGVMEEVRMVSRFVRDERVGRMGLDWGVASGVVVEGDGVPRRVSRRVSRWSKDAAWERREDDCVWLPV